MQKNDHIELARYLLSTYGNTDLSAHKKAFLLGCVEPDFNPFTYARGSLHGKVMRGHNIESSEGHIHKCINTLQRRGLRKTVDYFSLGTLIHYISDSFTFPHTTAFSGTMREHVLYENRLNPVFLEMLSKKQELSSDENNDCPRTYFDFLQKDYNTHEHTMQTDSRYIIDGCTSILQKLLQPANVNIYSSSDKEALHENTYYHRYV